MSGICGWIGRASLARPASVLDSMAAGLYRTAGDRPERHLAAGSGLDAATPETGAVHVHSAGLAAAVVGQPRLLRESDRQVAAHKGTAAAVAMAYLADPGGVLDRLGGGFALAILDVPRGRAMLAIDRLGVHSLSYAETPEGLVFATSLDALRAHPWVTAAVGPRGVYRYMLNTVSPAPATIYDDCYKLLPGYKLVHDGVAGEAVRYWKPPYGEAPPVDAPPDTEALFAALRTGVARSVAGVPEDRRGAFLSGGLDSSAICGLLAEMQDSPLPAFTIGFDDPRYDERDYARAAAAHFGLAHWEYALTPDDVAGIVPDLSRAFDEPFGNSSVIPAHFCARLARTAGIDLLVAGDGGDEIFAGNKRYREQKILGYFDRLPAPARGGLAALLGVGAVGGDPVPGTSPLAKARRYVQRARMPMPERMLRPQTFRRAALDGIFTPAALDALDVDAPYDIWCHHYTEAGHPAPLFGMQHLDLRVALADNDLRKVGRACEMAGVRVAYPMLDDDLVAFAARIPPQKLLRGLDLRHFFRRAMKGYLPPKVLAKKKHGFGMPFPEWTRTHPPLVDLVDGCIAGLKGRGIFRPDFLDEVRTHHRRGDSPRHDAIVYDLVMLELWERAREGGAARNDAPARYDTAEAPPAQLAASR